MARASSRYAHSHEKLGLPLHLCTFIFPASTICWRPSSCRPFDDLTVATSAAARNITDPAEELRARCRAHCRFALAHPHLYQLMFQEDLPLAFANSLESTPGRPAFENLVSAVRRCLDAGLCASDGDPFRLASLIWTAEHGLVLARISRPLFPWTPLDDLVDEMVTRMDGVSLGPYRPNRVNRADLRRGPHLARPSSSQASIEAAVYEALRKSPTVRATRPGSSTCSRCDPTGSSAA
jgi:WHG domain-containing protein